jgi:hypothetical protein
MTEKADPTPLATLCVAMLHELGDYPITSERIERALPLVSDLLGHIRRLDELDVEQIEPATVFDPRR